VNLLRTRDSASLWTESFDIRFDDIFRMQDEVAREVGVRLRLRLNPAEQAQLGKRYTENIEAYQLYFQGRYHFATWTEERTKLPRAHFERALEQDPNYALAYAGLADSYVFGYRDDPDPKEARQKGRAAAMKALEIDSTLGEAHAALAQVKFMDDWDWAGADEEFKRAIELSPAYTEAHHMYSHLLLGAGRIEESLTQSERFLELDPQSPAANLHMAYHYLASRQYEHAIRQLQKTLVMDPNYRDGHRWLGKAYYQKGMYGEAFEEFLKERMLSGSSTEEIAALRQSYAASGIKGYWQKRIEQLEKEAKHKHISAYIRAAPYAQLGEKDKAFELLEKAYEEHDSALLDLREELYFDPLRSDQRFSSLVRRIGLTP